VLRIVELCVLCGTDHEVTIMNSKWLRRPWHLARTRTHGLHSELGVGTAADRPRGWVGRRKVVRWHVEVLWPGSCLFYRIIIIIMFIIITCNSVFTRWQWSIYMYTIAVKFTSGGLHEKHVVATWNLGNHLGICF
jgi:hypothetical protein